MSTVCCFRQLVVYLRGVPRPCAPLPPPKVNEPLRNPVRIIRESRWTCCGKAVGTTTCCGEQSGKQVRSVIRRRFVPPLVGTLTRNGPGPEPGKDRVNKSLMNSLSWPGRSVAGRGPAAPPRPKGNAGAEKTGTGAGGDSASGRSEASLYYILW